MTDRKDTLVRELLLTPGGGAVLPGIDPRSTPGVGGKSEAAREASTTAKELASLQERLYAEGSRAVLLVLQGMDTSGKDGTIKHVFMGLNPSSIDVTAFKRPTPEEASHDFLWRIERRVPGPGRIGVFNRSHYEDVVAVRVMGLAPEEVWRPRYEQIGAFERGLRDSGTTVVKVYLHISYDEQRERLLARLDNPDKHWKFDEQDIEQRALWPAYMEAYEEAIAACSTPAAPWYIVPADRKWYRNWAVARILLETLREMDPRYPRPELDLESLRARLAPPH